MKAPFPWWGGKSRVAAAVWDRFGDVANYVEPFFGSGAVLLERPTCPAIETINDRDCMVANFWRALQNDPDGVAEAADRPVNEADQHAIHLWLVSQEDFRERMKTDIDYYDSTIAGRWVWGQCIWIGSGWCSRKLPHLGDAGKGVNRQLPHLGDAGTGVPCVSDRTSGTLLEMKRPSLGTSGRGLDGQTALLDYMYQLAARIRRVRVCCGDWSRICGPSPTVKLGITGVFLDPPYSDEAERQDGLYASDDGSVAHEVREWAIENGDNRDLRIALCGYEGEHQLPTTWECLAWKAAGGYGSQANGAGRANSGRERIWFSPHCLHPQEMLNFGFGDGSTEPTVEGEKDDARCNT